MRRRNSFGSLDLNLKSNNNRKTKWNIINEIISWVFGIIAAIFLGVMIVNFIGIKTSVVGSSMEPTLHNGEEILLNRIVYQFSSPKRGDIIAFYPNGNENSHLYVKRIVGLPGESIQIKQGSVYINGEMYPMDSTTLEAGVAENLIKLGDDEYFVMGDLRENSEDSRSANIGNVTLEMIEGKAWYHLKFENERMGRIE